MMSKLIKFPALLLAALVTACGGGGGDPGTNPAPYTIAMRAEKSQLPVNISGRPAGIGVYAPFTSTIYVQAYKGGAPIPDSAEAFACNVSQGLDSGSLYYLDGDEEHEDENGNPLSYRSLTLDANSGGASFHFHSGTAAGVGRIVCSVINPSTGNPVSTSIDILVGSATGKAASIQGVAAFPVLGAQGNTNNLRVSTAIQAYILDDANQPVGSGQRPNLQVAIAGGGASAGARLLAGSQDGSVVQLNATNGIGTFALSSGVGEGTILLEMTADRFDNDISNGIQDAIRHLLPMTVTNGTPPDVPVDPIELLDADPESATNGLPYSYAFSAKGGVAPYSWAALGSLPEGLTLSSAGVLSGTPAVKLPGAYSIAVRVTDSRGVSTTTNVVLDVEATPGGDPASNTLSIVLSGCGADVNTACTLAVANPPSPAPATLPAFYYQYVLSVAGVGTGDAVWTPTQAPSWLALSTNGILSITGAQAFGAPALADCTSGAFFITATRGGVSTMRKVQLVFGTGSSSCKP